MLSPGPWDLLCLLQERETQSAAAKITCPSQVLGGGGRKEAGIRLRLPCAIEKQKEKRQELTGQKEAQALLGLDGEREGPSRR